MQMAVSRYGSFTGPIRNGLLIEYRGNARSGSFAITLVQTSNTGGDSVMSLHIFSPKAESLVKDCKYKM
jgi:hypothetical protein